VHIYIYIYIYVSYIYIHIYTYVRATGGASGVGYVDKLLHIRSPRVIRPANGHMRPQTALSVHPSCGLWTRRYRRRRDGTGNGPSKMTEIVI